MLQQAKVNRADCFLATTNHDNVNLMIAQVAKVVFQVPMVIARIYDPARDAVYRELGVPTISPTKLSADAFLHSIRTNENEREQQP